MPYGQCRSRLREGRWQFISITRLPLIEEYDSPYSHLFSSSLQASRPSHYRDYTRLQAHLEVLPERPRRARFWLGQMGAWCQMQCGCWSALSSRRRGFWRVVLLFYLWGLRIKVGVTRAVMCDVAWRLASWNFWFCPSTFVAQIKRYCASKTRYAVYLGETTLIPFKRSEDLTNTAATILIFSFVVESTVRQIWTVAPQGIQETSLRLESQIECLQDTLKWKAHLLIIAA